MTTFSVVPIDRSTDFKIWADLWDEYNSSVNDKMSHEQHKNTFSRLIDPNGDLLGVLLVTGGGKPVGFAHFLYHGVAWSSALSCYMDQLYVSPTHRSQGGGRMLIEAIRKEAKHKGSSRLYWCTTEDVEPLVKEFYSKIAVFDRLVYKIVL